MWGKSTKQRKSAVRRTEWYKEYDKNMAELAAAEAGRLASLKAKRVKKRLAKKAAAKPIKAAAKRNRKAAKLPDLLGPGLIAAPKVRKPRAKKVTS